MHRYGVIIHSLPTGEKNPFIISVDSFYDVFLLALITLNSNCISMTGSERSIIQPNFSSILGGVSLVREAMI